MDPRISKQRTALVLDQPFFGALALRLKVIEDPSCKTFWTDSVSIGYNPAYLASLNDLETRGVLAHEVLHVANGHCWRQGDRDPEPQPLPAHHRRPERRPEYLDDARKLHLEPRGQACLPMWSPLPTGRGTRTLR